MYRRQFLTGLGAAGAVLALPACSSGPPAADAIETLFVQSATLGYIAERTNWLAFGIFDTSRTPVDDADVQVYLRTVPVNPIETEPEIVSGPFEATWSPPDESGVQGLYYFQAELPEEGSYELVAVVGDDHGTSVIPVAAAENSSVPPPGDAAPSAPTATTDDDLGTFALCTQNPPCGMHEMSLDQALESGRRIVLMFATPQFCQSAVCGPSVSTLDRIREDGDWGDTVFIHSEIFSEEPTNAADPAAAPLREAVTAYGLPSEPWLFTIDTDGTIVDRHDGAMPSEIVRALLDGLTT